MYRKEIINSGHDPQTIISSSDRLVNVIKEKFSQIVRSKFKDMHGLKVSTLTHEYANFLHGSNIINENTIEGYRYILDESVRILKELFVDSKVEWKKKDTSDVWDKVTSHYLITIDWS